MKTVDWLLRHINDTRRPLDWANLLGVVVIDPDGWEGREDWERPIALDDFIRRLSESTIDYLTP